MITLLKTQWLNARKVAAVAIGVCVLSTGLLGSKPAYACSAEAYIGAMCAFSGNFAMRGWALAHGQLLPINSNQALFSLIGTTYGGDGRTSFGLPDLRGRAVVGVGSGPGLSPVSWGQKRGVEQVTLTVLHLPPHTHPTATTVSMSVLETDVSVTSTLNAQNSLGTSNQPGGNMLAQNSGSFVYSSATPSVALAADAISASANATVQASASTTVTNTGVGLSHENRMPYQVINWLIATVGYFPSRS